jgi:hypothetical protein
LWGDNRPGIHNRILHPSWPAPHPHQERTPSGQDAFFREFLPICTNHQFHALGGFARSPGGTYISHLVSSGASVKTCQTLARHSSPVLTIGIYAKATLHDIGGTVESLPDLTPTQPHCEALSATGTEGGTARDCYPIWYPNDR